MWDKQSNNFFNEFFCKWHYTEHNQKQTNDLVEDIQDVHAARLVGGAEQFGKNDRLIMENTLKTSMKKQHHLYLT